MPSAIISDCGYYRYLLVREIEQPVRWNRTCTFIMLNPSTADATKDDPTIRKCIHYAKQAKCTRLNVVNLFAWRSTDPDQLYYAVEPNGHDNDKHITSAVLEAINSGGPVVCAWGTRGGFMNRNRSVERILAGLNAQPVCLKITKDGYPTHPLYISKAQQFIPFELLTKPLYDMLCS